MLTLIGLLGFLQITLIPGLILIRRFKIQGGLVERLIYVFPLSLIVNYLCVFIMTALGIYTRPWLMAVIGVEWAFLLYCFRDQIRQPFRTALADGISKVKSEIKPLLQADLFNQSLKAAGTAWVWLIFGFLTLSALTWTLHVWRLNIGTIFSGWDTLFSWNAYAETWAANQIPSVPGSYPQLVSANWSISYVLQGDNAVQFFNTLIPPLFFVWIFLMLFDLGFQKQETGFFIAAFIARYMIKKLMGDQIFNGYMDVPAASMVFLPLYTLLKAESLGEKYQKQSIWLAVLFSAGAVTTKQAGWITVVLVPVAIRSWCFDGFKALNRKQLITLLILTALIVLPFYLINLFSTPQAGESVTEIVAQGIKDFNQTYSWSHKWLLIRQQLGKYFFVIILSLAGLPLVSRKYRLVFFLSAWPVIMLWGLLFSYDTRNLAAALPGVAVLCGFALDRLSQIGLLAVSRWQIGKIPVGIIAVIVGLFIIIIAVFLLPDDLLVERQRELSRKLFGAELNQELLFDILGESYQEGNILTDYPANFLPGYQECCQMINFKRDDLLDQKLKSGEVRYLLIPEFVENISWESYDLLTACRDTGKCELIRCSKGYHQPYCLYEILP